MAAEKGWVGSASVIGACTLGSRVLGLARDVLMAAYFGTGAAMDAFVLAFMAPNLFRRLFGEGAVTSAFIPVFTQAALREGPRGAERYFRACFTALTVLLWGVALAGGVVCAVAPRWFDLNETWRLFFPLLSAMFPFMPLVCLTALVSAALNVKQRFFAAASSPALMNVFWILALVLGARVWGVWAVAVAVVLSAATQLGWLLWDLRRTGIRPGLDWDWRQSNVSRTVKLVGPMVAGLAVTQVNVMVDGLIAQFCVPGDGANSALYYANRLMQFPLGVIGVALGTALFPMLSVKAAKGDLAGMGAAAGQGMRMTLFVTLPVTALTLALARPIVEVILRRGSFDETSASRTAWALALYTVGLAAYCANQVLTRVFHARQDSKTPVKVGLWMTGLNLGLNLALVWPLREAGLALSTAVCGFVNAGVMAWLLKKREVAIDGGEVARCAVWSGLASAACGAAAWGLCEALAGTPALARLAAPMAAGGVVYAAAAPRMREWKEIVAEMGRKRGGARTPAGR